MIRFSAFSKRVGAGGVIFHRLLGADRWKTWGRGGRFFTPISWGL